MPAASGAPHDLADVVFRVGRAYGMTAGRGIYQGRPRRSGTQQSPRRPGPARSPGMACCGLRLASRHACTASTSSAAGWGTETSTAVPRCVVTSLVRHVRTVQGDRVHRRARGQDRADGQGQALRAGDLGAVGGAVAAGGLAQRAGAYVQVADRHGRPGGRDLGDDGDRAAGASGVTPSRSLTTVHSRP